jgi:hypothetical protein
MRHWHKQEVAQTGGDMAMLGQWLVLLHVISAFALIAGLIGREMTRAYARRQEEIDLFARFIDLSGWFESKLVIPGSNAVLVLGLVAGWVLGWPVFGVLQGSPINWLFVSLLLFLTFIPLVTLIFLPRGKIFAQRLGEARAQGIITPELRAAMDDPVVQAAHIYEAAAVVVIIYLMVMKPF